MDLQEPSRSRAHVERLTSLGHMSVLSHRIALTQGMCMACGLQYQCRIIGLGDTISLQPNTMYQLISITKGVNSIVQSLSRSSMWPFTGGLEAMALHLQHHSMFKQTTSDLRNFESPFAAQARDDAIRRQFPMDGMTAMLKLPYVAPIFQELYGEGMYTASQIVVCNLSAVISRMMVCDGNDITDDKEYNILCGAYASSVSQTIDILSIVYHCHALFVRKRQAYMMIVMTVVLLCIFDAFNSVDGDPVCRWERFANRGLAACPNRSIEAIRSAIRARICTRSHNEQRCNRQSRCRARQAACAQRRHTVACNGRR